MVCYRGGLAVEQNFQMCDVTSVLSVNEVLNGLINFFEDRKIIDTIPDNKQPQVTFSCEAAQPKSNGSVANSMSRHDPLAAFGQHGKLPLEEEYGTCSFQFWVDRVESFYCNLNECSWQSRDSFGMRWQLI